MRNKIELLAPAGDLEKLKYAIIYGADAVFIGGKQFSLRSMASNFTIDDIKQACDFAHAHHAKIHVTCNIVMHEDDLHGLYEYLNDLQNAGVDAIIASSPTILKAVKERTHMEAHVSTQQSVSNINGVNFFNKLNVDRVVLARECTMKDIKDICEQSKTDIEVFIEGGMCASVSGRCMLSNIMTNRDANRGGCAQSCRWNYNLLKNDKKVSKGNFDFTMSSCDLNALDFIPSLIDAGVASLKIEGRMKSLHYIATIVSTYRRCIDEYYEKGYISDMNKYKMDIAKGENRQVSHGFYKGPVTENEEIYNNGQVMPSHEFCGIVLSYEKETGKVVVEQRNIFSGHRDMDILSSKKGRFSIHIDDIYDINGNVIDKARHAQEKIVFYTKETLEEFDIIR